MHILYVVHQFFPYGIYGTERLVLNISKQMQRIGHQVTILTYGVTDHEGLEEKGKFLVKCYQYQGISVISVKHKFFPEFLDFLIIDEEMVLLFEEIFLEQKIDIMHICHLMRVGSIIKFAQNRNIPVILTLTDFWLICPRGIGVTENGELCDCSNNGIKCSFECYLGPKWVPNIQKKFKQAKDVLTYADTIVSGTQFLREVFLNKGLCKEIEIIPFGKDYANIKTNSRNYDKKSIITIGYLSSLLPHKGAHILIEAFLEVNPSNMQLLLYGDTKLDTEYSVTLKKLSKNSPNIQFKGKYKYESMPEMLENIDIVAVPSLWWENSPLVLLRSLVHNVPAIVSNLGGLTEIITDGKNGFTFSIGSNDTENGDSKSLSSIIQKISEDPSILNELKENISPPPRIEEEAFAYECIYKRAVNTIKNSLKNQNNKISSYFPEFNHLNKRVSISEEKKKRLARDFGEKLNLTIDERDEMFQFLVSHPSIDDPVWEYFSSGCSMVTVIKEIFSDNGINIDKINNFLDFACGYGRFARFLPLEFPFEKITVADIDHNAVDFCKNTFELSGFYSVSNPNDLFQEKKYDVIWVASLFSHLPISLWEEWLKKLYSMLSHEGFLIFSTHGLSCYDLLPEETKINSHSDNPEFLFVKQSETNRLDVEIYGSTYVSVDFVNDFIIREKLGTFLSYYQKKLWNFQDIYVLQHNSDRIIGE